MISMLAAWEWGQIAGLVSCTQRVWLAMSCGLFLVTMMLVLPACKPGLQSVVINAALWISPVWWLTALILVLFYPSSAFFWRQSYFLRVSFGALTLIPFFCGMLALRQYRYNIDHFAGAWWLMYIFLLVWGADTGAYMFGRLFGRHKLAPQVSPGKTWQGFAGGLLTSLLVSWLFVLLAPLHIKPSILIICSVTVVFASVIGDLTESMFKREAGIKDSGNLIPGHGGVLDRIDSLTAAVPIFACLLLLIFRTL